MKFHASLSCLLLSTLAAVGTPGQVVQADLKEAIPTDMFLAIHGQHNPERDYQQQYYGEIWETVQETQIIEKVSALISARMSDDESAQASQVRDALTAALEPVEWEKLEPKEIAYGQKLNGPMVEWLLLLESQPGGSASLLKGIRNLLELGAKASEGNITLTDHETNGAKLILVGLGGGSPISPVFGIRGDTFIFCSSPELAETGFTLLDNPSEASKFDDARVAAALKHLPAPEDALVFFDGRMLSGQLSGIPAFIKGVARGNEEAIRVADLLDKAMSQLIAVDHEISVEYTDGNRNVTESVGYPSAEGASTVAGRMLGGQKQFEDWTRWIPANTTGFSLSSGANIQPLYAWVTNEVKQAFPGSEEFFVELAGAEEMLDVKLDEDLLSSFSGETVSISAAGGFSPFGSTSKSIFMTRCSNPARINQLLDRAWDAVKNQPELQSQGISVAESSTLKGFRELKASFLALLGGASPVIGFEDDWMVASSHSDFVTTLRKMRAGEGKAFADTERFTRFGLEIEGPVRSVSFSDTGKSIRDTATGLQQAGAMIPLALSMTGQSQQDLEPVQEVLTLLPSIGRIVGKFDFIQSSFSVTQHTDDGGWKSRSVTLIRPPAQ